MEAVFGFLGILLVAGFFLGLYLLAGFFIVRQQTIAIIERFGRFRRTARPGLGWRLFLIDRVVARMSLRIQQLDVRVETKTQDNVFVNVVCSVQYYVIKEKVVDSYYRLQSPEAQITSYVYDVVRARVPVIKLDEVFEAKDEIAQTVRSELAEIMDDFGYGILKALVTDIDPDAKVKSSMNQINAAQRLRQAAIQEAEAEKIRVVKAAEGEAESKALQGKGIADQRLAIVNGLRESVTAFQDNISGTSAHDVMNLVLMTQYFDTLKDIGVNGRTNAVFVPHTPGAMNQIGEELRQALIGAEAVNRQLGDPPPTA